LNPPNVLSSPSSRRAASESPNRSRKTNASSAALNRARGRGNRVSVLTQSSCVGGAGAAAGVGEAAPSPGARAICPTQPARPTKRLPARVNPGLRGLHFIRQSLHAALASAFHRRGRSPFLGLLARIASAFVAGSVSQTGRDLRVGTLRRRALTARFFDA